jgi:DNA replication and repair protein RecF
MRLAQLWLTDFRCYEQAELEIGPGMTVLSGGNASGKTSILEAVGWLARMSSFRGAPDVALVRAGAERAFVRAEVAAPTLDGPEPGDGPGMQEIGLGQPRRTVEAEITAAGRNRVLVNRKPLARARDLLGTLRVTVFSPDDLRLVKGGPAERRAELDDLLVALSPRYDAARSDYERVLRHRNAWLKSWSRNDDPATLDVWDDQLTRAGAELVRGRLKLLERLETPLAKAYADLAGAGAADVAGTYDPVWAPGEALDESRLDDVAPLLAAALARSRPADLERRISLVGPHRDDWSLTVEARDARRYASQGEQRSLALAIRLAGHAVVAEVAGEAPVLLLDDVFSELDDTRSAGLVAHLPAGQALVTTAGHLPAGLPAERVVWITGGRLGA